MTTTSTRIVFGLFDQSVKMDSTPSSTSSLRTYCDLDSLATGNIPRLPWATYEPDFFLLDGNYKFHSLLTHDAFISDDLSDENGDFATPPVLTIDFSTAQSVDAITLYFSPFTGDYASSIRVQYNDGGGEIRHDDYTPTATEFTTDQAVADFTQIVITFYSTNRPYRSARLESIDYGGVVEFDDTAIQSARIVEEIDPVSGELRANTLDFTLFSTSTEFTQFAIDSLPSGRQPVLAYETRDGVEIFMGQFFLESWKNTSEQQLEFHCVDLIGFLENIPYRGGMKNGSLNTLLADILEPFGIPYFVEHQTAASAYGWLSYSTLREAVHQIASATGAASCARARTIRFISTPTTVSAAGTSSITSAEAGFEQSLTLLPEIVDIQVTGHYFIPHNNVQKTLVDSTLSAGTYEIIFDNPMHTLTVTGATIDESGANYAILTVASTTAVELTGYEYTNAKDQYVIEISDTGNVIKVTDATMIIKAVTGSYRTNRDVYQTLSTYYSNRYRQELTLFAPLIEVGDRVYADSWHSAQIHAIVERMDIDLTGGMIARVTLVGQKTT